MVGSSSSSGFGGTAPAASDLSRVPEMMGRYAPVARLGKGGMADVFLTLAYGLQGVNKLAVVKRLRNTEDPAITEMFLDEARLSARFNHANIVHTYEVGEVRGEYFIAMEYLEGQPLSRLMKTLEERHEGLPEPLIAFIAIQALKGLHYAHEFCDFDGSALGVVHRDVSPHNFFVTYDGEIKLLDFGIAKVTRNGTHTEDGVLKGKVRYMAPEQATQGDLDRRVDVYAFGVLLWEMLARRPLFTGAPLSILTRIMNEEIPPVRGVRPAASPVLEAIALKATHRIPDQRYATAEEMRLQLEEYLGERRDSGSERDLARVMSDLFAEIRDDVRARVKEYAAKMPPPQKAILGSTATADLTSTGKLPVLPSWNGRPSAPSLPAAALPSDAPSARELAAPRTARFSRRLTGFTTILFFAFFAAAAAASLFALGPPFRWRLGTTAPLAPAPQPSPPALASAFVPTATVPFATRPPLPLHSSAVTPPDPTASSAAPSTSSSAFPPAPTKKEGHRPYARPIASSPASSPSPPAPSAASSAPTRPNIRMLEDSESP